MNQARCKVIPVRVALGLSILACSPAAQQRAEPPPTTLLSAKIPKAKAGDEGWKYQQRASADLDGDGVAEAAVLISDVTLDARGQPMWDDGHRWQVYVEEPSGERTYVYARFLPNGKLTAQLTHADMVSRPTLVLLEQMPYAIGVYEITYDGPDRIRVEKRLDREIRSNEWFLGSPRP
jgi:hypothetical protein